MKGGEMFMSFPMTIENLLNPINGYEFIKIGTYGVDEHFVLAPETILMQFTGLKDKQGKEIYEGDIVENGDVARPQSNIVKYVTTLNMARYIPSHLERCEVIGNIYENPELLRKDL